MSNKMNKWKEENKDNIKYAQRILTNRHRSDKSLYYLHKCKSLKLLPRFTQIGRKVVVKGELQPKKIRNLRIKKFERAINDHVDRIEKNEKKYKIFLKKLENEVDSTRTLNKIKIWLEKTVADKERKNDRRRTEIFEKEILVFHTSQNEATITILNETDIAIPPEITKILRFGLDSPIGSQPNTRNTLAAMEILFDHWSKFATKNGISELQKQSIRAQLWLKFDQLLKCKTNTKHTKPLSNFLEKHPNILLCPTDKGKNLIFLNLEDYQAKLKDCFSDEKIFEPLSSDPLKNNIVLCQKSVRTMKKYVSDTMYNSMIPLEANKRAYGLIKVHKLGSPCRPIVSSLNSLTAGSENYLFNILSKLQ